MLKRVFPVTLAFDCEWVPDAPTIRRVFDLGDSVSDLDAIEVAWANTRKDDTDKRPFLKVGLCRVVSICAVMRKAGDQGPELKFVIFPPLEEIGDWTEARVISTFLTGVGKHGAQLVGYNCIGSDLPALTQRAVVNGIACPDFAKRPEKPWEGNDYFSSFSDSVCDLGRALSFGKTMPSMHEIASACCIPGKMDVSGADVFDLWNTGDTRRVIEYNVFDALTTYLLWLRCAQFSGLFGREDYLTEVGAVRELIDVSIQNGAHFLSQFLDKWNSLSRGDR